MKWWQLVFVIPLSLILASLSIAAICVFFISLIKVDRKISVPVIGAMLTAFISLAAVIITQRSTKQREIEEAHREKKVEIYEEFFKKIEVLLQSNNPRRQIETTSDSEELITYLSDFKTSILLWGSPQVLQAYDDFARISGSGKSIFEAVDNLYRTIRVDIGLSNKGLPPLHLVKMHISDPESIG
jgi:hypothetical protein